MTVQQVIWIVLIGAIMVAGFPVQSPDISKEDDRELNYEDYVRQLEKKHKLAYNDIDEPWQPLSDDSVEFVLTREDFSSARPLINVERTSQAPIVEIVPVAPVQTEKEKVAEVVVVADEAVVPVTEKQQAADTVAEDEIVPVTESQVKQQVADETDAPVTETQDKPLADTKDAIHTPEIVSDESSTQVAEVEKQQVAVEDDSVAPVTENQEKPLADTLTEDEVVPVTETQVKLLSDLAEGSGQSDTATEQEVITLIHHEPAEDTTESAVTELWKADLLQESLIKVDETTHSDVDNEGSGGPLTDSASEGSGLADSLPTFLSDDIAEGSGSPSTESDELFRGSPTTIIPSNDDDTSTATDSQFLIPKDGLATEETTTESTSESDTIHLKDLNEKEVKSTESPIESTEQTEIQPSPTEKIAQADEIIAAVVVDLILPTNKLQPDIAANDSTDPATESTTLESVSFVALSDDAAVEEI